MWLVLFVFFLFNWQNEIMWYDHENVFWINFIILNMPINVLGNSNSIDNGNKIDTSIFVQKPHLGINYIESIIEGDKDWKKTIEN